MAFLELSGVSKSYGEGGRRSEVLRGVDLEMERGEVVAIVGYSGSGKTTLLSLVAGLLRPDAGSVRIAGATVTGPGPDRGVVFQNYSLLPWLTSYGNIELAVEQAFPSATREERRARVERHLQLVNLVHARDRRPSQLSGGMRQRVALARALAMDPKILLLDEPLGALLMVTHDVDEALLLADRVVPLDAGPSASLGPAVAVSIERPRERRAIQHDARFKHARAELIEYLLGPGARRHPRLEPARARHGVALVRPMEVPV